MCSQCANGVPQAHGAYRPSQQYYQPYQSRGPMDMMDMYGMGGNNGNYQSYNNHNHNQSYNNYNHHGPMQNYQEQGKGKGKARDIDFDAAFAQFADLQPSTSAQVAELQDHEGVENIEEALARANLNKDDAQEQQPEVVGANDFSK